MKNEKKRQTIIGIRQQIARHKRSICLILAVLILLTGVVVFKSYSLNQQNKSYIEQEKKLEKTLAEEKENEKEIDEFAEYVKTDEYVEKIAKEKLGLAYEDEILFEAEK